MSVTTDSLTTNLKVVLNNRYVHKADKEVPGIKKSNVLEKEKNVVTHIRKVPRTYKQTEVFKKSQLYLKTNYMIIQTQVVEQFLINLPKRLRLLLIKNVF